MSSNACRALAASGAGSDDDGAAASAAGAGVTRECVSRSTVTRGSKWAQSFRLSFGETRLVIGCAHSSVWLVSNQVHCAQLWRSAPHPSHCVSNRMEVESSDCPQR